MNAKNQPPEKGGRKAGQRAARQAARRRQQIQRLVIGVGMTAGLVLLVVAFITFGGGSDDPPEPSAIVDIEATDFAYSPSIALGLAGEIVLNFENKGLTGHELVILQEGIHISSRDEFNESMVLGRIDSIARDIAVSRTVTLDAGTYQLVCLLPDHFEAGMASELAVS